MQHHPPAKSPHHGPCRAMGLVLEIPVCPLHGVPLTRGNCSGLRHLSWEHQFDPHPTLNHCPKTMARVAIADAALSPRRNSTCSVPGLSGTRRTSFSSLSSSSVFVEVNQWNFMLRDFYDFTPERYLAGFSAVYDVFANTNTCQLAGLLKPVQGYAARFCI